MKFAYLSFSLMQLAIGTGAQCVALRLAALLRPAPLLISIFVFAVNHGSVQAQQVTTKTQSMTYPGDMVVRVIDPAGKPLPNVIARMSIVWKKRDPSRPPRECPITTATTNTDGVFKIHFPHEPYFISFVINDARYVPVVTYWYCLNLIQLQSSEGNPDAQAALKDRIEKLPSYYVVQMQKGVRIGGRIVNEQGKPVANARIEIAGGQTVPTSGIIRTNEYICDRTATAQTDVDGRWHYDRAPERLHGRLDNYWFRIVHPDYFQTDEHTHGWTSPTEHLRNGSSVIVLKRHGY